MGRPARVPVRVFDSRRAASALDTTAPSGRAREIGAVERHSTDSRQHELRFHERREMDVERQRGERRHVSFVDPAGGSDFEIGLAGQCLHRRAEAAGGRVAREVDRYDHRYSERHGEDSERRTQ